MLQEKVANLLTLEEVDKSIPDRVFVSEKDFQDENFENLKKFLKKYPEGGIYARTVHKLEDQLKGGTGKSIVFYENTIQEVHDVRKVIIDHLRYAKRLSILRQQKFNGLSQEFNPDDMGLLFMPYIKGWNIMAKYVNKEWEFGISGIPENGEEFPPRLFTKKSIEEMAVILQNLQRDLRRIVDPLIERCDRLTNHLYKKKGNDKYEYEFVYNSKAKVIYTVQARDISKIIGNMKTMECGFDLSYPSLDLADWQCVRNPARYRKRPVYIIDEKLVEGVEYLSKANKHIEFLLQVQEQFIDFALEHENLGVIALDASKSNDSVLSLNQKGIYDKELPRELIYSLGEYGFTTLHAGDLYAPLIDESDLLICPATPGKGADPHIVFGIDNLNVPFIAVKYFGREDYLLRDFLRTNKINNGSLVGVDVSGSDGKIFALK